MSEWKLVPVQPTQKIAAAMVAELPNNPYAMGATVLAKAMYRKAIAAATSPAWVKTSEQQPFDKDGDEDGAVWFSDGKAVRRAHYTAFRRFPYWMPKPRVQPPEPPEKE